MNEQGLKGEHPLGLTVHSIPSTGDVVAFDGGRTRLGRWKMLMVLVFCAAPVVASYFTYYVIRPEGRRNFGELIDPQQPLPDVATLDLNGAVANLNQLKGQWLLISVADAACNALCEKHLYLQRQLREGLGKNKDRVDWVWLISDEEPLPQRLIPALKTAVVQRVPKSQLLGWLPGATAEYLPTQLYVVDPLGNLMMRFPSGIDTQTAPKVKRDLERLLRASAFWDQPGRPLGP